MWIRRVPHVNASRHAFDTCECAVSHICRPDQKQGNFCHLGGGRRGTILPAANITPTGACVCVCVCACVCVCVRVCVCPNLLRLWTTLVLTYICTQTHISVLRHIYLYSDTYICTLVLTYICTQIQKNHHLGTPNH